jgi:class 3 adenylate cyclase
MPAIWLNTFLAQSWSNFRRQFTRLGGAIATPSSMLWNNSLRERSECGCQSLLATVLFADIAGSTERVAAIGDNPWRELLNEFYVQIREVLQHYRGREISTAGDGFLAAFDGPARAIRCANALGDAVRPLGLKVRCGIHTGECELIGDDLAGIAVHIGARVAALATPGEVLVSQTVRDLVAGSGLTFEDRGSHSLKGVPDEWRLFRAVLN